jgi:hypothetical protein
MATDWPAYARLWTVATAGQSAASYTTSGDTTPAYPAAVWCKASKTVCLCQVEDRILCCIPSMNATEWQVSCRACSGPAIPLSTRLCRNYRRRRESFTNPCSPSVALAAKGYNRIACRPRRTGGEMNHKSARRRLRSLCRWQLSLCLPLRWSSASSSTASTKRPGRRSSAGHCSVCWRWGSGGTEDRKSSPSKPRPALVIGDGSELVPRTL